MLEDFLMQPVWIEIGSIGPGDDTKLKPRPLETFRIGQRSVYAGLVTGNQLRHIGNTTTPVDKGNRKPVAR